MHPQSQKNGKPSSRPGKMFIVKLLSNTADMLFFSERSLIFFYILKEQNTLLSDMKI